MKEIKDIIAFIDDEIDGADEYIKYAVKMKGVDDLAYQTALRLAAIEMEHVDAWHTVAVKAIEAKRAEMKAKGQTVPAYMQEMWDDEHAEYVEKVSKLKYKLETAKK